MKEVKKVFPSPSNGHQAWNVPMATKHGTFQWPPSLEPSNGHRAWNIPMATKLGTFQWPPNMEHSNGHQAWNIPLATKLWIHFHLPSPSL